MIKSCGIGTEQFIEWKICIDVLKEGSYYYMDAFYLFSWTTDFWDIIFIHVFIYLFTYL